MKMKRILFSCLLLLVLTPAFALFCQDCGKKIPDSAKFCPQCGKAQGTAATPVPLIPPAFEEAPSVESPAPVVSSLKEAPVTAGLNEEFMRGYQPVEQLELLLTGNSYRDIAKQAREHRSRMALNTPHQEKRVLGQPPALKKMHELQLRKMAALERYLEAWQRAEARQDVGPSLARRDKELFLIGQLNEMITTLTVGSDEGATLERVAELETALEKASREYVVTAPFLEIGSQRLHRNDRIWVIEVSNGQARILHMGPVVGDPPVHGWVAVSSLDKRTSWRYEPALLTIPQALSRSTVTTVVSAPVVPAPVVVYETAPQPPSTVIVIGKSWCRRCGYFSCRCHRHFPRTSRYPHPGPHRRGDRGRSHVIIRPRYW